MSEERDPFIPDGKTEEDVIQEMMKAKCYTGDELLAMEFPRRNLSEEYPGDWSLPTPLKIDKDCIYGTEHKAMAIYGDWHVTECGDVIQAEHWYPIWSEDLEKDFGNDDWVLHLTEKDWFDTQSYEDFKRAYWLACKIIGIEPTKQITAYSQRKKK